MYIDVSLKYQSLDQSNFYYSDLKFCQNRTERSNKNNFESIDSSYVDLTRFRRESNFLLARFNSM